MCTLHFCVDLLVDGCDVISHIYLYLYKNCVINALPGYSMVFILAKNIKPKMILLCKLSIRLINILRMCCARFDQHNIKSGLY